MSMKQELPNRHDVKNAITSVKRLADMLNIFDTLSQAEKELVADEVRKAAAILERAALSQFEQAR